MKFMRLICFILLASLIGLFGVALISSDMNHTEMTNPCPYTQGKNSMCPMTIAHHAQTWLSLFLATPTKTLAFLSLTALTILIVLLTCLNQIQNDSSPGTASLSRSIRKLNPLQSLFSYLVLFFRLGILHPKVF